jgi:phage antirepressor YoqD-like protein
MDGIIIQQDAVYKTEKGTPVTDSLKVAQVFGRQHKNVIRSIRDIMMSANLLANRQTFCESTYYDSQGKLAKIICQNGVQTGEKRLFQWVRDNGYLCQYGERYNQPTQKAMEMGLFEIKKTTIQKPNGDTLISNTTKVTGKGQVYFVNKFLHNHQKNLQP